ncbi:hypothetical protein Tco_0246950 [Tanacetum coccineum]
MSMTKEQQQALDDALVPREQRLTIGSCNYKLSTTFNPKEPTFQVALDLLTLTPFYPAFLITVSEPAVYMQEFWAIKHASVCPKLPGQKFVDPPFEEEILTLIREHGYPGNIKLLSDVKVDTLPQPWRTFRTIINKCLSDLVFHIENKESRKNKYMFYLRFTKVIINHFMSQDQSIPRRNKVDWHMANDDLILINMRFIPQHEVVQRYDAILLDYLTNLTMKESEAYKTYLNLATGKVQPKLKYVRRSSRTKTDEVPKPSSSKRVKSTAKAEQLKLATKRSLIQTHSSHASGSGAHEGTGVIPGVLDVPDYEYDNEQISWKSSEEEDDDEVNVSEHDDDDDDEQTKFDNDGKDFVHPKFSTHDDEARQEEVNEEDSFDPRVQTPSHVESTDDDNRDEEVQGANTEEEEMVEEATHEEDEANELYRDVNVNLEGRDTVMTYAPLPNVQATQETEDTHVILTASIIPEDVPVTTIAEPPLVFATTLPPPPTPLITHMQQISFPIPTTAPNSEMKLKPKIIKDQVKEPVKAQVSKILLRIEKTVNEQLKVEVMTRSSTESKTSLAIAANLSELELKKILIEMMESNKRKDNEDKDEEPSAGSNRGSKRRRAGKELESTSAPKEKTSKTTGKSNEGLNVETLTPKLLAGPTFELMKGTCKSLVELEYFFKEVYKATTEQLDWHNPKGQQYPHDLRNPLPLIPNSCGRQVIPFDHFINNDLAYLCGGVSGRTYATSVIKTKAADYSHIKWIEELVPNLSPEYCKNIDTKKRGTRVESGELGEGERAVQRRVAGKLLRVVSLQALLD